MSIIITMEDKKSVIKESVENSYLVLEDYYLVDLDKMTVKTVAESSYKSVLDSFNNKEIVLLKRRDKRDY